MTPIYRDNRGPTVLLYLQFLKQIPPYSRYQDPNQDSPIKSLQCLLLTRSGWVQKDLQRVFVWTEILNIFPLSLSVCSILSYHFFPAHTKHPCFSLHTDNCSCSPQKIAVPDKPRSHFYRYNSVGRDAMRGRLFARRVIRPRAQSGFIPDNADKGLQQYKL